MARRKFNKQYTTHMKESTIENLEESEQIDMQGQHLRSPATGTGTACTQFRHDRASTLRRRARIY